MKEFIGHKIQKERIDAHSKMVRHRESEGFGQGRGIKYIYAQYWNEKLGVIMVRERDSAQLRGKRQLIRVKLGVKLLEGVLYAQYVYVRK